MTEANENLARVRLLARYANLPLPTRREATVAAVLDVWVMDANELSEKMNAPEHRDLAPVTVLTHPAFNEDTER